VTSLVATAVPSMAETNTGSAPPSIGRHHPMASRIAVSAPSNGCGSCKSGRVMIISSRHDRFGPDGCDCRSIRAAWSSLVRQTPSPTPTTGDAVATCPARGPVTMRVAALVRRPATPTDRPGDRASVKACQSRPGEDPVAPARHPSDCSDHRGVRLDDAFSEVDLGGDMRIYTERFRAACRDAIRVFERRPSMTRVAVLRARPAAETARGKPFTRWIMRALGLDECRLMVPSREVSRCAMAAAQRSDGSHGERSRLVTSELWRCGAGPGNWSAV
jgi:hypothetical protein